MSLRQTLYSDANIDAAYRWLCYQRRNYHHNDDVWGLRHRWTEEKNHLQQLLRTGRYTLGPLNVRRSTYGGDDSLLWDAIDALVLRALTQVLSQRWLPQLSKRCYHLAGRGGVKAAIHHVKTALPDFPFVFRTDVKGYYANIDQAQLQAMLAERIDDRYILQLLQQAIACTLCDGGNYHSMRRGICRGCSLSPLLGALYLDHLDQAMARRDVVYVRFMDDWVVLCRTHTQLRRVVASVNRLMTRLTLAQHPDKTYIGRVSHGFEFLGWQFTPMGVSVAATAVRRCIDRITQLYEQGATHHRIGTYLQRWWRWYRLIRDVRTVPFDESHDAPFDRRATARL
ncbi:reverse transcriptase/maturase family protein [Pseudomonas kielensis]|uniref:reverse transcriptase/maturase family protein n=1 Tax=Pseudomonas kielensis TaxID=2762577 RepID=UPI002240B719|nr:reverse transcriptase/maturase family protein [Pseudomonas kielensis]UZM16236.1 reverse transcriptase/maturase family protein [Pseudomonas kielensis]